MKNNNMPDVGETIEKKTYRLVNEAYGSVLTSFEAALDNVAFLHTCKAIELAIAEEREACGLRKAAIDVVREALDSVEVHPCDESDDNVRAKSLYGPTLALYQSIQAAPKDEVSE